MKGFFHKDSPQCPFCGFHNPLEITGEFIDENGIKGLEFTPRCCDAAVEDGLDFAHDVMGEAPKETTQELINYELQFFGLEEPAKIKRIAKDLLLNHYLRIEPITLKECKKFVGKYHGHCNPPHAHRFSLGCFNGDVMVGVASTGNPVAPFFMGKGILEVNRLATIRDETMPKEFLDNVCSMLYSACAKETKKRGFQKIITYTTEHELGTSLKASSWVLEFKGKPRGTRKNRQKLKTDNVAKYRWSRLLTRKFTLPFEQNRQSESKKVS